MRTFLFISTFILAGLLFAIVIGFDLSNFRQPVIYDDEQEMLDNQYIIRFSHVVSEASPKGEAVRKFAEIVDSKTDGLVKVEIYPNGVLYNDNNEWEAVNEGKVEMIAPATSKLTNRYPRWQVLDLPFAFPNYEAVDAAYNGKIRDILFSDLAKADVIPITFWYNGFKQMTYSEKPLLEPDDFVHTHFRIMPSDVIAEQFQTLGASTSAIPFNKTYRNLEVKFVEGQENTISNIYTKKFYENQQYLTFSNHGYLGYVLLINRDFWESLPTDLKSAISEAIDEVTEWNRRHAIEINDEQTRELKLLGNIHFNILSVEQQEKWKNKLRSVYTKFSSIIGDELMQEVYRIQEEFDY
ncbi:DctP family TRAP transporter solute-binding subunit [Bacillaceae bacterium W0354]